MTEYQYYNILLRVMLSTFPAICWHIESAVVQPPTARVRQCLPMPRFPGQSDG